MRGIGLPGVSRHPWTRPAARGRGTRGRPPCWRRGRSGARGLLAGVLAVVLAGVLPTATADHDDSGGSSSAGASQGSDGAVEISVEVSYTQAQPGSGAGEGGGGGATTTTSQVLATMLPVCYHQPYKSGQEMAEYLTTEAEEHQGKKDGDKKDDKKDKDRKDGATDWLQSRYPGWQDHADDTGGYWYHLTCDWSRLKGDPASQALSRSMLMSFLIGSPPVWVPAGGAPPVPLVDGATLASAAWDAVEIPVPQVGYNPALGGNGATLVGWYTWVWATGETPARVEATATAGPVSATVTAEASGLGLSAPDSQAECDGFGTPWQPGAPGTDCTIVFTRSSAHLGGTTPLETSVRYQVTYTATDGTTGTLDTVTTTSTHHVPVAEAQALNTNPT